MRFKSPCAGKHVHGLESWGIEQWLDSLPDKVDAYGPTGVEPIPASGEIDAQKGSPSTNELKEYFEPLSPHHYVCPKIQHQKDFTDVTRIRISDHIILCLPM
jgi:hypothetical protein